MLLGLHTLRRSGMRGEDADNFETVLIGQQDGDGAVREICQTIQKHIANNAALATAAVRKISDSIQRKVSTERQRKTSTPIRSHYEIHSHAQKDDSRHITTGLTNPGYWQSEYPENEEKICKTPGRKIGVVERRISSISNFLDTSTECVVPVTEKKYSTEESGSRLSEKSALEFADPVKVKYRKSTQLLAAVAANMGAFTLGIVLAWSATAVPEMKGTDGSLGKITSGETAWITSIVTLGALVSCPMAAYSMVTVGRKKTMILLTPIFCGGWLLIRYHGSILTSVNAVTKILIGRFITGLCGGAYSVISPVYIAETAHDKIRGGLASGFDLMLSAGMLYIYAIGSFTSWEVQTICSSIVPVILFVLLLCVPESPRFLVESGDSVKAAKTIQWLYGIGDEAVSNEMHKLKKSIEESQSRPVNFDRVVMKLSVLKPTLLSFAIIVFYVLSGVDAIVAYTVVIFESTGAGLDPKISTLIVGVVQLVASIPACLIVDKFGRRKLLLISESLMAASLFGMGLFYFLTKDDEPIEHPLHNFYGWLPLVSLNMFIVAYSIGIGPLALALVGELIPSHITGMMTCTALMLRWAFGFGVEIIFESLGREIGFDSTYWIFTIICGFGAVFVYFCLPETKGMSLDQIQTKFIHPSKLAAMAAGNTAGPGNSPPPNYESCEPSKRRIHQN